MRKRLSSRRGIVNAIRSAFIDMILKKPHAPLHRLTAHPIHPALAIPYGRNIDFHQLAEAINKSAQRTILRQYTVTYDNVRRAFVAKHRGERPE